MESGAPRNRYLPFPSWWPLVAGALAGVILRLVYSGRPGQPYAAMTSAWGYYAGASAGANVLFVLGTMAILIEGLICAVIILPLFALFGVAGGLIMGSVCRLTNWPKQTLGCLVLLPIVLGGIDSGAPLPDQITAIDRSVVIQASPEIVWQQILNARDIRPDEVDTAWLYRIGVPLPKEGRIQASEDEFIRRVKMVKEIYFDEVITDWRENQYIRWSYRFYADSFPPHALDEHVVIGGHYFDVRDTTYTLTPRGRATELTMSIRYRVSTRFSWYASPAARFLIGNLEESNLNYYRARSEAQENAT